MAAKISPRPHARSDGNKTVTRRLTNPRRRSNNPVTEFPGPPLTQDTIVARKELATSLSGAGMKRARWLKRSCWPSLRFAPGSSFLECLDSGLLACPDPAHGRAPAHAPAANSSCSLPYRVSQTSESILAGEPVIRVTSIENVAGNTACSRHKRRIQTSFMQFAYLYHRPLFRPLPQFHQPLQCAAAGRAEVSP